MHAIVVATFYCFIPIGAPGPIRTRLVAAFAPLQVKGTLLLAPEGVNGTLAGSDAGIDAALALLREAIDSPDLVARTSRCDTQPFKRLKIRVRREIVTLGVPGLDPAARTGTAVRPADWNAILRDPAIPVIDVRNGFEHAIGTFAGATDPGTKTFTEFPGFVERVLDPARHKAVAMFCTGGIRCEKASALMLARGFETVYQLEGGILAYLAEMPAETSLWRGDCFVFDERGAVGPRLDPVAVDLCRSCSHPLAGPAQPCRVCGAA